MTTPSDRQPEERPPSHFARLGKPSLSIWLKCEYEVVAWAYVQALANGGDTWRRLTMAETRELLTPTQQDKAHPYLKDHPYTQARFDRVADFITGSDRAREVSWFWKDS